MTQLELSDEDLETLESGGIIKATHPSLGREGYNGSVYLTVGDEIGVTHTERVEE